MPALDTKQFVDHLTRGKPVPAVLLLGSDLYLRDLCRAKLIEASVPEDARDWGVSRFSAADDSLDRALAQCQTLPMLAPRQVVFLEDVEAIEKLGDKDRDAAVDQVAAYLADPAPFTVLVLEAASLDKRMTLFKTLTQKVLVVSVNLGESPEERIPAATLLVPQMATDVGVSIDREAAADLADLLDGDLSRIRAELEKLAAYVADRKRITPDDVDAMVISSKKYTVWQLAEMLAERRRPSALAFLDSLLREGEPPPAIVGALAWMYRKLIEAQELSPRTSPGQAAGFLRMRQSAAAVALEQSRKIPRRQLLDGLVALYEADSRLKSGVADQRAVLEFLLARLMSPFPA